MQTKELKSILDKMTINDKRIPIAYHSFKASNIVEIPSLPYIIYFVDKVDIIGADNKVKYKDNRYIVELYTEYKNIALEEQLEKLFDDANIYYEKFEAYIKDEIMFQISYQI